MTQIYKTGFVEQELHKLALAPMSAMDTSDYRHAIGILAAAMLMILDRLAGTPTKEK